MHEKFDRLLLLIITGAVVMEQAHNYPMKWAYAISEFMDFNKTMIDDDPTPVPIMVNQFLNDVYSQGQKPTVDWLEAVRKP